MIEDDLPYADTTLLILCGGSSRRMGGRDKGLMKLHDKPMVAHLTERFSEVFADILISCNRHLESYAGLGYRLARDPQQDMGPLGGLLTALQLCQTSYLAVTPCDTPFVTRAVYDILLGRLHPGNRPAVIAHDGNRQQLLHAVFERQGSALSQSLNTFLAHDKTVKNWYRQIQASEADCSAYAGEFRNINAPEDLDECSPG